jgi:hypothetical protein
LTKKKIYFVSDKKTSFEKFFKNYLNIIFDNFGMNFIRYSNFVFEIDFYLNNVFLGNLISFYNGDIVSRASRSMNLAYIEFEHNQLNFF